MKTVPTASTDYLTKITLFSRAKLVSMAQCLLKVGPCVGAVDKAHSAAPKMPLRPVGIPLKGGTSQYQAINLPLQEWFEPGGTAS